VGRERQRQRCQWRRPGQGSRGIPIAGSHARERTALILTVLNEAGTLDVLLDSVARQSLPPDEVVIVDGGSTDSTVELLHAWGSRLPLRVIQAPGATISRGRNAAIAATNADIIAVTDAGVRLDPEWLARLRGSLGPDVDVVSGFFRADPRSTFERALGATALPEVSDVDPEAFLPSSRSVLFRRSAWECVGGYPEWLDYCEDLVFDLALRRAGRRFAFAPAAVAHFRPRTSLQAFFRQYYLYARGDGKADLWRRRHAIRYATYAVALTLLLTGGRLRWLLLIGVAAYTRRPYQRLPRLKPVEAVAAVAMLPVLRGVGDVAKMLGYPVGVVWRLRQ
jgi:glycosyltransferase involved in cell wall biosynthesis